MQHNIEAKGKDHVVHKNCMVFFWNQRKVPKEKTQKKPLKKKIKRKHLELKKWTDFFDALGNL